MPTESCLISLKSTLQVEIVDDDAVFPYTEHLK